MPALVQFAQKAVIQREREILLVQKSADDPYQPGRWELPGGRMEQGESLAQALIREVREEVGLTVVPREPLAAWSWTLGRSACAPRIVCVAWLSDVHELRVNLDGLQPGDHIERALWVPVDNVLGFHLISSARPAMEGIIGDLRRRDRRW